MNGWTVTGTATIMVNVEAGLTVTCTKGATAQTKTFTGSVMFTVEEAGTCTITAAKNSQTESGTVQVMTYGQTKTLSLAYVRIYGVSWDGSSTTKLSRTDDAGLFAAPTPAVGTGAGFSPFDNCYPWSGMTKVTDGEVAVQYRSIVFFQTAIFALITIRRTSKMNTTEWAPWYRATNVLLQEAGLRSGGTSVLFTLQK